MDIFSNNHSSEFYEFNINSLVCCKIYIIFLPKAWLMQLHYFEVPCPLILHPWQTAVNYQFHRTKFESPLSKPAIRNRQYITQSHLSDWRLKSPVTKIQNLWYDFWRVSIKIDQRLQRNFCVPSLPPPKCSLWQSRRVPLKCCLARYVLDLPWITGRAWCLVFQRAGADLKCHCIPGG